MPFESLDNPHADPRRSTTRDVREAEQLRAIGRVCAHLNLSPDDVISGDIARGLVRHYLRVDQMIHGWTWDGPDDDRASDPRP